MPTNSISRMPAASLVGLMVGLIDYAGLFPPAAVTMDQAVANYAEYHRREGWSFLGRFIVPAARLQEFERSFNASAERCWCLSVTFGPDFAADLQATADFIERTRKADRVIVSSVEIKVTTPEQISEFCERMDNSFGELKVGAYFEVSPGPAFDSLLPAIRICNARAKIRTGGLVPDAFPDAETIARFIAQCAEQEVAFKATAGLHHPLRCMKPLTYEANAPTGTMHGFLNVFVASVVAFHLQQQNQSSSTRDKIDLLRAVLLNEDPSAFNFDESALTVHAGDVEIRIPTAEIETARDQFCISFGSCSFEEPIEDLRSLNLL